MSESVILYSSRPISGEEFIETTQVIGENNITRDDSELTGSVWDGERVIFLYGDWVAPDPELFWEKELRYTKHLPEIEAKLGGKPATSLMMEIGKSYGSGSLAVELAYQCTLRWPCVVLANRRDPIGGTPSTKIYSKEDVEQLYTEGLTF